MALLSCRISVVAGKPGPGLRLRSPASSGESSVGFSYDSGRRNPRLSSFPAPSAAQWDERRREPPGEGRGRKPKPPKRKPEEEKDKGLGGVVAGVGGLVKEVPEILDAVIEKAEAATPEASEIVDGLREKAEATTPEASEIVDELREEAGETVTEASGIPDEWGERAEPEAEPPAEPDPPREEDEWGRDPGNGASQALPAAEDVLGDLKRCLVDTLYGTEYGLTASSEVRAEVLELVNQLEAKNPTPAPMEAPKLLDGNWILL